MSGRDDVRPAVCECVCGTMMHKVDEFVVFNRKHRQRLSYYTYVDTRSSVNHTPEETKGSVHSKLKAI